MPMYRCDSCGYEWASHSTRKPQKCPNNNCDNPRQWNALRGEEANLKQIKKLREKQDEVSKVSKDSTTQGQADL